MPIPVESSTPAPVGTLDGRLRFPATDDRLAYETHGPNLPLLSQAGKPVVVYTDAAGTSLADIVTTAGVPIAGSTLTVDNNSQIPEFFGPVGVEVLYARLNGGTAYPIYAWLQGRYNDYDAQFTSLDTRVDVLEGLEALVELTDSETVSSATYTLADSPVTIHDLTLAVASCALTLPTPVTGRSFLLVLRQDATGSRVVTWPGNVKWPNDLVPLLQVSPGALDAMTFFCLDTTWRGSSPEKYSA